MKSFILSRTAVAGRMRTPISRHELKLESGLNTEAYENNEDDTTTDSKKHRT